MLVTAKNDVIGYGPIVRIPKGRRCIVYAIETIGDKQEYYVIPLLTESDSTECDPLAFPIDNFTVLEDKTTAHWQSKYISLLDQKRSIRSFHEWFENNFYIRAHDWNLEDDDYDVMNKYKDIYENIYKHFSKYDNNLISTPKSLKNEKER